MADDNDIERLEQRLKQNRAKRGKLMKWLAFSVPIYWLAIFRLTWSEVDAMIEKATLGIQEVNVGIISIVLVSVTSASVAATLMNAPIYMIIRQLSRDIKADEIALRQARRVRDTILLRNTTDLEKSEIEELLKDSQAESQNEDENNTGGGGKPGAGLQNKTQNKRKRWGKLLSWIFWFRKK